ncbi:MAG: hypothetical protein KC731_27430, partial [Myxococcales bacterium]|nr:hypothetical protein [Myxococcales bacterium]
CPKLAESQRLDPGDGTLLNLAVCHEKLGRTATAWSEFKEALASTKASGRDDRTAFAEEHIAALEPRLAHVTIVVPDTARVEGLRVMLDEQPLGAASWGVALPVDPGAHQIAADAPNHQAWHQALAVVEAGNHQISVPSLTPAVVVPPPPPPAPLPQPPVPAPILPVPTSGDAGSGQLVAGYVVGGVGVAAMVAGAVFGGLAIGKENEVEDVCPDEACPDQAAVDLSREAVTFARVSTGLLFGGLAVVGVGLTLVLTAPDEPAAAVLSLAPAAPAADLGGGITLRW